MRFVSTLLFTAAITSIFGLSACSDAPERQMIEAIDLQTDVVAEDVDTAIEYAKLYTTKTEKIAYLIKQGRFYYENNDYQGAADLARYILEEIDSESAMAEQLLDAAIEKSKQVLGDNVPDFMN
jgi:septation ring formation regulator EzrA